MSVAGSVLRRRLSRIARRRTIIVSAVTAASSIFALISYGPLRLVPVNLLQAMILLALATVAIVGVALGIRVIPLGVGVVMIVLGLVRLVTYGNGSGLITGGVGTAALLVGLGMAYIGVVSADDGGKGREEGRGDRHT